MSWQQTFVIVWTQFAAGTLIMLCLTRFALNWVSQPVERTRLISGMLGATLLLPAMLVFSPFPSWNLPLMSLWATDSLPVHDATSQNILPILFDFPARDAGDALETAEATSVRRTQLDRTTEQLTGGANPSIKGESSIASRWTLPDAWTLLACASLAVHALAVAYFVIEQAIGWVWLRRLTCNATNASDSVYSSWASVVGDRGENVRLLVANEIDAPLMFGWLRPTIVIPHDVAAKRGSDLHACLAHEWSHIESHDVLTRHFINFCQLVLWYQPLFWNLRRELRVCQEILADHRTASAAITPLEYSELLFRLAEVRRPIRATGALTMIDRPSELARRIKMLLETPVPMNVHCRRKFSCVMLTLSALLPIALSSVRINASHAADKIESLVEPNAAPDAPEIAVKKSPEPEQAAGPEKVAEPNPELPRWRSVSYTKEITVKGQLKPAKTKDYLAEDGRMRIEIEDHTVSISDAFSNPRLTLTKLNKTAHVNKPRAMPDNFRPGERYSLVGSAQRHLENIKSLCTPDCKTLGQKDIDGKLADGFVAKNSGNTYTIWIDSATGELVRVEYDASALGSEMHIAMSNFRFGEKLDESLFSLDVPSDYKVYSPATVSSETDNPEKRAADAAVGLKKAWSNNRKTCRIAAIPGPGGLWTVDFSGKFERLDEHGKKLAGFQPAPPGPVLLPMAPSKLIRVSDMEGNATFNLLNVGIIGSAVNAYDSKGKLLWSYVQGDTPGHAWMANDICAVDLTGDGRDEVVIGFNGLTGLHVLDHQGNLLWKETSIGNVWHVSAGNVEGDARPEVICTSALGKAIIFNGEGKLLRVLDAGVYANMIRTWQPLDNSPSQIIVAGTVEKQEKIVAIDSNEKPLWSLDLADRVVSATTCQQKPWLALTLADGTAHVIDVFQGKEIARIGGQGATTDAAWLPVQQGDPLLVIANQAEIVAYRIENEMP